MNSSVQLTVAEVSATLFGTSTERLVPTDTIIKTMLDVGTGISDLIFSPGRPPQVERYGELVEVKVDGLPTLRQEDTAGIAQDLIRGNETVLRTLKDSGSTDLSYVVPDRCRFRVNVFRQRGTFAIVMRVIASRIPSHRGARSAAGGWRLRHAQERHRARHGSHRIGQVVDARRDHRPDQRDRAPNTS